MYEIAYLPIMALIVALFFYKDSFGIIEKIRRLIRN